MKTRFKLIKLLEKADFLSVQDLAEKLKVSSQYVHRVLLELLDEDIISKMGKAPKVYYRIKTNPVIQQPTIISYEEEIFLKENFVWVDPIGKMLTGYEAIEKWCLMQELPLLKTIQEYKQTKEKYLQFFNKNHLIDGKNKLISSLGKEDLALDEVYYLDFYAIERFGKTRLGAIMHYAKQGQNIDLMKILVNECKHRIINLIHNEKIDAIVYVPPTIKRKTQIMTYFEKNFEIKLPKVKVDKIHNQIIIPQKALSKLFERTENAKNTFVVPEQKSFNKLLLLDDAIGSGSTMNEIAKKLKSKKIAKQVIGLAVTGSYKDFEVISEI